MASVTKWRVWSFQHAAWWKPNRSGYTADVGEAGEYDAAEATEIVKAANRFRPPEAPDEAMMPVMEDEVDAETEAAAPDVTEDMAWVDLYGRHRRKVGAVRALRHLQEKIMAGHFLSANEVLHAVNGMLSRELAELDQCRADLIAAAKNGRNVL